MLESVSPAHAGVEGDCVDLDCGGTVSPAHAGVEARRRLSWRVMRRQPRACGGPGGGMRLTPSWVGTSSPGHSLHEGRVVLEEGWGYSTVVGGSCSTHNLRSVDPHPRGVGRPEAGRASADVEPSLGGCAETRRDRAGGR